MHTTMEMTVEEVLEVASTADDGTLRYTPGPGSKDPCSKLFLCESLQTTCSACFFEL